jgi:RES domain-containing protein
MCKTKYLGTALSGFGAKEYGGRWNSVGVGLVYLAGSVALAALEVMVHVPNQSLLRDAYSVLPLEFSEDLSVVLDTALLPQNWNSYPAPEFLKQIGDEWIKHGDTPLLRVPSAVIPSEFNYLYNPNHEKAQQIRILEPQNHLFDSRLVQ